MKKQLKENLELYIIESHTNKESKNLHLPKEELVSINIERLQASLDSRSINVPIGLTSEERHKFLMNCPL